MTKLTLKLADFFHGLGHRQAGFQCERMDPWMSLQVVSAAGPQHRANPLSSETAHRKLTGDGVQLA